MNGLARVKPKVVLVRFHQRDGHEALTRATSAYAVLLRRTFQVLDLQPRSDASAFHAQLVPATVHCVSRFAHPAPHQQRNTPFCVAPLNLGFAQASHKSILVCVGVWHGSNIRLDNQSPPVALSLASIVLPCHNSLGLLYIADTAQTHGVTSVPRHPSGMYVNPAQHLPVQRPKRLQEWFSHQRCDHLTLH